MGRFVPRHGAVADLQDSRMVRDGMLDLAQIGAAGAKRRAPVDTGELRDDIAAAEVDGVARYGTDVEHGLYQEVGTYKMEAQPYLRPAQDDIKAALR